MEAYSRAVGVSSKLLSIEGPTHIVRESSWKSERRVCEAPRQTWCLSSLRSEQTKIGLCQNDCSYAKIHWQQTGVRYCCSWCYSIHRLDACTGSSLEKTREFSRIMWWVVAKKLFKDAQAMLRDIKKGGWLTLKAAYGIFPPTVQVKKLSLAKWELGSFVPCDRPVRSLNSKVLQILSLHKEVQDYVGCFAVTAGLDMKVRWSALRMLWTITTHWC